MTGANLSDRVLVFRDVSNQLHDALPAQAGSHSRLVPKILELTELGLEGIARYSVFVSLSTDTRVGPTPWLYPRPQRW